MSAGDPEMTATSTPYIYPDLWTLTVIGACVALQVCMIGCRLDDQTIKIST